MQPTYTFVLSSRQDTVESIVTTMDLIDSVRHNGFYSKAKCVGVVPPTFRVEKSQVTAFITLAHSKGFIVKEVRFE